MRLFWITLFLLSGINGLSQPALIPVGGLPTKELYDLHVDKKGYLWVAHGLGISRYDGLNFINYTHPEQVNLRMTDIVEDPLGRIWYHNFSGQVFYIEAGKTSLLKEYDYKKENQTPRMAICGEELLVTSYKGLFALNTTSFKASFFPFPQTSPTEAVSLAVIGNRALLFNNRNWYVYEKSKLTKIPAPFSLQLDGNDFIQLQPSAFRDTVFLTANPSGILYKIVLNKNNLQLAGRQAYEDFINAVSTDRDVWVHTRNNSYDLANVSMVNNYDLTDVVTGKEGNTWYSSRREGLLISYKPSLWKQINFKIDQHDYIRSLNANAGYFFAGTQRGTLYRFRTDSSGAVWKHEMFNGLGSIEFIRHICGDQFIIGSSTSTYIVDAKEKRVLDSLPIKSIYDVGIDSNSFYLATPEGVYIAPFVRGLEERRKWLQAKKQQFSFYNWSTNNTGAYLLFPQRTHSIRFDSLQQKLYAATKNGLFEVDQKSVHPYFINGKEVWATSIAYKDASLYIGTVNDGLWIVEKGNLQHFTTANHLTSNMIIRVKVTEDHLWLYEKEGIQVLDIHTNQILQNIDLPNVAGSNVLDITELGDYSYVATAEGVYKIPLNVAAVKTQPKGYLDYVIINGRDTLRGENISLRHNQNDVQFFFSSPSFYDPEGHYFRYRLRGVEKDWSATSSGERMIRYSSLPPGDYTFELYAFNDDNLQQEEPVSYSFSIARPWWNTWWFYLLLNLSVLAIALVIIRNRAHQRLKIELMRSNISRDLHDDIGATLSSLNFYIALAETEENKKPYLDIITENISHVVNSLDDLIWSINPRNDTTEQLVNRMKAYATPLLKAANIQCGFQHDPGVFNAQLDLAKKRHLFLLFKEMINNVLKHSGCRTCYISLAYSHSQLSLSVTDDGKGFDPETLKPARNGLLNMRARTQKMNGKMEIRSAERQGSRLEVKIPA